MAASTPSTTRTAMMASRYSVYQSGFARRLHARIRRARTLASPRTSQPAASRSRDQRRAGASAAQRAIDQQRLGGAADAGAAHLGVERDRRAPSPGRHRDRRRRGSCPPGARSPARAPPAARARPGSCRRAARARRCTRCIPAEHLADRGAIGGRHQLDARRRQPRRRQSRDQAGVDAPRSSGGSPSRRAECTALPDFRHSAPASAVTFGRLS